MDYKPAKGYDGSKWVGWQTFHKIFKDADFLKSLKNSIVFNLLDLLVGFPMPIILALMLNELRYPKFKKVTQTILYLPHFLSWVIVGSVGYRSSPQHRYCKRYFTEYGRDQRRYSFPDREMALGSFLSADRRMAVNGMGNLIYLAAITGISGDLYEAAMIDGAGRWKRMWYINPSRYQGNRSYPAYHEPW